MSKKEVSTDQLITTILEGIEEVKGQNIDLLDLREIENMVCDYFIVCNGTSNTQVAAIVNSIQKTVSKKLKDKPWHAECRMGVDGLCKRCGSRFSETHQGIL